MYFQFSFGLILNITPPIQDISNIKAAGYPIDPNGNVDSTSTWTSQSRGQNTGSKPINIYAHNFRAI